MLAALLGMLAELVDYTPAFPIPGERPEDALARVRPLLVIVLDGTLDSARSDLFFAQAAKRRVGIVLFGGREQATTVAALAQARGVQWFEAPIGVADFQRVLGAAASSDWWKGGGERRGAQPRREPAPATDQTPDGTLVFLDRDGRRWLVYDRRGSDRRQGERRADDRVQAPEPDRRLFVNESGETWECTLTDGEVDERSPAALERQLARAARV
jgi:hypothetical protein